MNKSIRAAAIFVTAVLMLGLTGCSNKFWDPTQIGRFRPVPAVNVILETLGVADEEPSVWEGAEEPKPVDVVAYETDYVFGPGDVVRISIYELRQEGVPFINDYIVTETGKISIPDIGILQAQGLTEAQLEEELRQILSPSILKEPAVTATLMSSQQRSFTIYGQAVPQPGRYFIPRYDFRLTDALATAGGVAQFNVSYIYVSRAVRESASKSLYEEKPSEKLEVPEDEMLEIIAPHARQTDELVLTTSEMITAAELEALAAPDELGDNGQANIPRSDKETIEDPLGSENGRIEWIFEDGKWTPVRVKDDQLRKAAPARSPEELIGELPSEFDWHQAVEIAQSRVILIPADKLSGGDPRYNIIVRPGDSVHVPLDVIGEYFIYGNTNNQGAVPMTGRPLTLKMAIAAAGGLGPLAWPKRVEITRRIGRDKEETVMVDLDKIASGEQPDFFIRPLDLINVGTHATARWRAVLRNAFRATYGFGFLYDRNFADRDFGTRRPIPDIF